jgi:molybdate/tungstate transport system ATP-binding protein
VLMVTHDFTDAHTFAQRVAILHDGHIEQTGSADTVFRKPATTFVADFVGMRNVLPARVENGLLVVEGLNLAVPDKTDRHRFAAIRPEHVHIQPKIPDTGEEGIPGRIRSIVNQGLFAELAVEASGVIVKAVMLTSSLVEKGFRQGERVLVHIDPADIHPI